MGKPDGISQAAWDAAIATQDAAIERCKVERLAYPFPTCNGKTVLDEVIAAAIDAASAEGAKAEREALAAWIELQRADVPAHGWEFAAAIRARP